MLAFSHSFRKKPFRKKREMNGTPIGCRIAAVQEQIVWATRPVNYRGISSYGQSKEKARFFGCVYGYHLDWFSFGIGANRSIRRSSGILVGAWCAPCVSHRAFRCAL